jgi:hypothetical protein
MKDYWSSLSQKVGDTKNNVSSVNYESSRLLQSVHESKSTKNKFTPSFNINFNLSPLLLKDVKTFQANPIDFSKPIETPSELFLFNNVSASLFNLYHNRSRNLAFFDFFFDGLYNSDKNFLFFIDKQPRLFNEFTEMSRFVKRTQGVKLPFRLVKNFLPNDQEGFSLELLFKPRFGDGYSNLEEKNYSNSHFLVLKQKKYSRKDSIRPVVLLDENTPKLVKYSGRSILLNNSIFSEYLSDPNIAYRLLKKNKKRIEMIPTTLSKRLLRTKRTLILPAHINITLITNSFDIVHSWFIPGLGVKLDCVPGRSTHHTFYVDNVGFYFGQCAEICGRYHHHMPIRVCALPFEHFLVW